MLRITLLFCALALLTSFCAARSLTTQTFSTMVCTTDYGSKSIKPVPRTTFATTTHSHVTSTSTTSITSTTTPSTSTTTATAVSTTTTTTTLPIVTDTYTSTSIVITVTTSSTTTTILTDTTTLTTTTSVTTSTSTASPTFCTQGSTPAAQAIAGNQKFNQKTPGRPRIGAATTFPSQIQCTKTVTLITTTAQTQTAFTTVSAPTPVTTVTSTSISTTTVTSTPVDASTTITTTTTSTSTTVTTFTTTSTTSTVTSVQTQYSQTTVTTTPCATNFLLQATGASPVNGQYCVLVGPGGGSYQEVGFTSDSSAATAFGIDGNMYLNSGGAYANEDKTGNGDNTLFFNPANVAKTNVQPSCSVTTAMTLVCAQPDGRSVLQFCPSGGIYGAQNYLALDSQVDSGCTSLTLAVLLA